MYKYTLVYTKTWINRLHFHFCLSIKSLKVVIIHLFMLQVSKIWQYYCSNLSLLTSFSAEFVNFKASEKKIDKLHMNINCYTNKFPSSYFKEWIRQISIILWCNWAACRHSWKYSKCFISCDLFTTLLGKILTCCHLDGSCCVYGTMQDSLVSEPVNEFLKCEHSNER